MRGGGGGTATALQPVEARLNTYGGGDMVRLSDLGTVLDRLGEIASDRGYRLMVPK
jgi:hypothetical protein